MIKICNYNAFILVTFQLSPCAINKMRLVTTCEKLNKSFIENSASNLMHLLSWIKIDTWFACYMNF